MAATGWRQDLAAAARPLSAAVVSGLITGLVVGGLGGRIAMFVLRLTSSSSLHGVETDHGAIIGVISLDTIFLLLVAAAVGILGGVLYLAIRGWLPRRGRIVVAAAFGAVVGGAQLITPHGLDFTALAPLWLAIAMFIAISAAYGAMICALIERRLAEGDDADAIRWTVLAPLLLLLFLGPGGFAIVAGAGAVWLSVRRWPSLVTLWRSPVVVWLGRAALVAFAAVQLSALVGEVGQIL
jgi:hypothetical protein